MELGTKIPHKTHRLKMKHHNDVKLLTSAKEISLAFNISLKSRGIYRTYLPSKTDPKLHKRPILEAMDIYTYLKKENITYEVLIGLVRARRATLNEIMGKL